ncbi:MAG: PKD domain-containing protein [Thermoplasmata archaeon]|nr:PKD domain-containing protein [Thermoplasmata archaeon]
MAVASFALWGGLAFAPTHGSPTYSHVATTALSAGIKVPGVTYPTTAGHWGSESLAANVSGANGSYTCSWTFGDGGTSNSCTPDHSWTTAGTYTVALTVTNGGSHARASMKIGVNAGYVTGSGPGNAGSLWSWVISNPCTGVAVGGWPGWPCGVPVQPPPGILAGNLVASGSITYSWNPGDGTGNINGQVAIHNYGAPGTYTATLNSVTGGSTYHQTVSMVAG